MRTSTIPSKVIRTTKQNRVFCIGCSKEILDGFYYTGSVLAGQGFIKKTTTETTPVLGFIEIPDKVYVIGGEKIEKQKSIPIVRYNKGEICSECGSNPHCVTIGSVKYPIVKTDPNPKFLNTISIPVIQTAQAYSELEVNTNKRGSEPHTTSRRPERADNHWLDVGRKRLR